MTTRRIGVVSFIVAAVVTAGAVAGDTSSSSPPTGAITLVGTTVEHHVLQPERSFPGRESWRFSLASQRAKGKAFGYGVLACSYVGVATTLRQCTGTFALPRGKIMVAGSMLYAAVFGLAVTGGVDYYSSAGGNLFARRISPGTFWLTFGLK